MLLWPRSFDAEGAACSCLGSRNACDKDVAIRFCRRRVIVVKILICYNITIYA